MKLTQWFHDDSPVHVGVYERDVSNTRLTFCFASPTLYSNWNGVYWGMGDKTAEQAATHGNTPSQHQNLPWRGVAK